MCLQCKRPGFDPGVRKIPWRRKWLPVLVFSLGEFQGEEPGGLQSMGSQRVRHDRVTFTFSIPVPHLQIQPTVDGAVLYVFIEKKSMYK